MRATSLVLYFFLFTSLSSSLLIADPFQSMIKNHDHVDMVKVENRFVTIRYGNFDKNSMGDSWTAVKALSSFEAVIYTNDWWHKYINHHDCECEHAHVQFNKDVDTTNLQEFLDALKVDGDEVTRIVADYALYIDAKSVATTN